MLITSLFFSRQICGEKDLRFENSSNEISLSHNNNNLNNCVIRSYFKLPLFEVPSDSVVYISRTCCALDESGFTSLAIVLFKVWLQNIPTALLTCQEIYSTESALNIKRRTRMSFDINGTNAPLDHTFWGN